VSPRRWSALIVVMLSVALGVAAGRPAPAEAIPNPVGVACGIPGVSSVCGVVRDQVGNAAGALANGVFGQVKDAVIDATVWAVTEVVKLVDVSTRIDLGTAFLTEHYRFMTAVGALFLLPFLLAVVVQGVLRADGALILRAVFGHLPAAALLTVIAIAVIQGLLAVTDGLSEGLLSGQAGLETSIKDALPNALGGTSVPVLLAIVIGFVLMAAALMVWLELLVRSAAIQIAVMFLPLFLAGLVWPMTARYARRLAEILGALIISKLVITGILSLALAALASGDLAGVLSGTALFLMAAFAPFIVLALIPIATDAGHLSQSRRYATASSRTAQTARSGATVAWQAARSGVTGGAGAGAGAAAGAAGRTPRARGGSGGGSAGLPVAGRRGARGTR
jgi:hypothetical protein